MNDLLSDTLLQHFSTAGLSAQPARLTRALAMLQEWLAARRPNAYPAVGFATLAASFAGEGIPRQGMPVEAFLTQLDERVLANSAQLNHPMYIGHMTQALPWITVLAEAFAAALNQNQVKIETAYASTLVEKQVLGWLHRQVYRAPEECYAAAMTANDHALGNMVSGGTMGNLTALAVALERTLPGTRKTGLHAALVASEWRGLAVLGSARVHYSVKKALATLGLGEDALHLVPVDADNRIDLAALRAKLAQLREARIRVVALVGVAGTTETGAIDPLDALADICRAEDIWFHVDAAWGGGLLLSERMRHLYAGIEAADSVVIDGHKLFWVPMAQGMVLFKDKASLNLLKHHANYIIRRDSADLGQTSLEGSRRFDALKLWTALKIFGLEGYDLLLRQSASLSQEMQDLLASHPDFECITTSDTFILTYRYAPRRVQERMRGLLAGGAFDAAHALNRQLNALNAQLQESQKREGRGFVSRTVLESTAYPGETTVLRAVLTNVTTRSEHLRAVLDEQQRIGAALLGRHDLSD